MRNRPRFPVPGVAVARREVESPSTADDPADAAEKLHWWLFHLTSAFRRRDHEQISAGGLTLTQCSLLYTLRKKGPLRTADIAELSKVSAPTATQAVSRLERLGLVRRFRDPSDQRVSWIEITDTGSTLQREAVNGLLDAILTELTVAEIIALKDALAPLERISRAVETELEMTVVLPHSGTVRDAVTQNNAL